MKKTRSFLALLPLLAALLQPGGAGAQMLDAFESATSPAPWTFYNGAEYPGATGSLSRAAGHSGSGARLAFNTTAGGNYVSATLNLPAPAAAEAVALWVRHPGGSHVQLRVTDSTGQTLQYSPTRPFESRSAAGWYRLVVRLSPSAEHWGGSINDGVFHGPLTSVSILAQPGKTKTGALDFDDVEAVPALALKVDPFSPALTPAGQASTLNGGLGVEIEHVDAAPAALDLVKNLGFRWTRTEMFWADVETTAGVYDFTWYDSLLAALKSRGLNAHFILCYGNPVYTGADWFQPPRTTAAVAAFGNFSRAAAAHFAGKGVRFEIWNEPDIATFWSPPSASEYAALSRAAIAQIHAGDPSAQVSTGGLAGMDMDFLGALLAAGGAAGANAIGVHPYRLEAPEQLADELLQMRAQISQTFPISTPVVWSTESGYSSAWYGDGGSAANRLAQAKLTTRGLLTEAALGLGFNNVFALRDHGPDPWDAEQNFGIYDCNLAPKPLAAAVRAATAECGSRIFDGILPTPASDLHILKFESANAVTLACWSEQAGAAMTKVEFPSAPSRALDFLGNPVAVAAESSGGFSVNAGDAPVYVTFPMKLADTFSINGGTRTAGRAISGLPAETGGNIPWQTAGASPVLTATGMLAPAGAGSASGSGAAHLFLGGILAPPLRFHAKLNPSGTDSVSAGFYSAPSAGGSEELCVRLRAGGLFTVIRNGVMLFPERAAPAFRPAGGNLVELALDRAANSYSLWINGSPVCAAMPILGTAQANFAGAVFAIPALPVGFVVTASVDEFQVN